MSDWWEKYIYLRSRAPLLINSNYYGLGYAYHVPSNVQTARASIIAHYFAHFKILLESERLAPTTMRGKYLLIYLFIYVIITRALTLENKFSVSGTVPICMRQYERMFGLTRVPGYKFLKVVKYST